MGGRPPLPELVAGALQDRIQRAVHSRQKPLRKGSVPNRYALTNDTAVKMTTARYYNPSGRSIQAEGIEAGQLTWCATVFQVPLKIGFQPLRRKLTSAVNWKMVLLWKSRMKTLTEDGDAKEEDKAAFLALRDYPPPFFPLRHLNLPERHEALWANVNLSHGNVLIPLAEGCEETWGGHVWNRYSQKGQGTRCHCQFNWSSGNQPRWVSD